LESATATKPEVILLAITVRVLLPVKANHIIELKATSRSIYDFFKLKVF
jgi:hypothetical protein